MKNSEMPAMPVTNAEGFSAHPASGAIDPGTCSGLTKREYFAGLAMQGLCASDVEWQKKSSVIARNAVIQADALLAELDTTNEK